MRRLLAAAVALALLAPTLALATGTTVITVREVRPIRQVVMAWTSTSGGAVDTVTTWTTTGYLIAVSQVPGTAGDQPTDAYDVRVLDANGIDLLAGNGIDLSNAANVQHTRLDTLGTVAYSALTLEVRNAGDTKTGSTVLYFKE